MQETMNEFASRVFSYLPTDKSKEVQVFPHARVDGDCVGTAVALVSAIRKLGYSARVMLEVAIPPRLSFMNVPEDLLNIVTTENEEEIFSTPQAASHGFAMTDGINDPARRFKPTIYAMARGAWYSPVTENLGNGFWLLRTNGYTASNVNYICDYGYVYNRGTYVITLESGEMGEHEVDVYFDDVLFEETSVNFG